MGAHQTSRHTVTMGKGRKQENPRVRTDTHPVYIHGYCIYTQTTHIYKQEEKEGRDTTGSLSTVN